MNEELQKQLAALLQSLMQLGGEARQFANEQIPPLVAEKILLGRIESMVGVVFLTAAIVFCAFRIPRYVRRWQEATKQADALGRAIQRGSNE